MVAVVCAATVLGAATATMVNVALPRIGTDLGASFSDLQWIANVFTVVLASFMLPAATLGTNLGRRRMFCVGLGLVATGSSISAAAPGMGVMLLGRVVQALGAGITGPTSLGIIARQFDAPAPRARAIGLWAAAAGVGLALGPLAAGTVIQAVGWRGVFWATAALALGISVVSWVLLAESRHGRPGAREGVDVTGALVMAGTLAALSFGFIEGNAYGWGSPLIVGSFLLFAGGVAVLVVCERTRQRTGRAILMPTSLWRSRAFVAANIGGAVFFLAVYGVLFLYSVYCEQQLHFTALRTGLVFLPMTATMAVLATLAGRITRHTGVLPAAFSGLVIATIGCVALVTAGARPSAVDLALRFAVLGVGFGLVSAPLTVTAVAATSARTSTVGTTVYNASRQVGAVVGVAVLGAIAPVGTIGSAQRLDAAMLVVAVLLAVTAALLLSLLPRRELVDAAI